MAAAPESVASEAPAASEASAASAAFAPLDLTDELNLYLVARGVRPGYFRYGKAEEIDPTRVPPGVSALRFPIEGGLTRQRLVDRGASTEYFDRPKILYHGPGVAEADLALLREYGWDESKDYVDEALGRALGFLSPGAIKTAALFVSYVVSFEDREDSVVLYAEAVPDDCDEQIEIQKRRIYEALLEEHPNVSVHLRSSFRRTRVPPPSGDG